MSAKKVTHLVVDASVVVKWLLPEPGSEDALAERRRWTKQGIVPAAPNFLLIELHNVFWKKLQRNEIDLDAPIFSYSQTFGLDLNWFPFEPLLTPAWNLACRLQISVYDALYVALAHTLQACFYTADGRLAERLGQIITVKKLIVR